MLIMWLYTLKHCLNLCIKVNIGFYNKGMGCEQTFIECLSLSWNLALHEQTKSEGGIWELSYFLTSWFVPSFEEPICSIVSDGSQWTFTFMISTELRCTRHVLVWHGSQPVVICPLTPVTIVVIRECELSSVTVLVSLVDTVQLWIKLTYIFFMYVYVWWRSVKPVVSCTLIHVWK